MTGSKSILIIYWVSLLTPFGVLAEQNAWRVKSWIILLFSNPNPPRVTEKWVKYLPKGVFIGLLFLFEV
jgi:hypothetical protein